MGCGAVQNSQTSEPVANNLSKTNNSLKQIGQKASNHKTNKEQVYKNQLENHQTMNHSYQIKEMLGKGTYGQVYRCVKNDTKEQFALKIVKLTAKNRQQAKRHINNLKSQISVLKKLNHPNIVKYHAFDISPDNQTVEIVFELVQNGSLKDFINKNGPLNQEQASRISKQILKGLDYLHQKSIIHRDLKCANILISQDRIVKITDFGTAKEVKVKTNQDIAKLCASLKGTPYYMAPEILKRSGHHKSADIWSFGCTLIQMLTGKAPWTTLTDNFQQIISYIISGIHPPLPPNISKQCEFFLQSCLDAVPSQRLTAGELLNHRFILMNTKATSPSLVYQKITPKSNKKSEVSKNIKNQFNETEKVDLNSIQIKKRKKSIIQQSLTSNNNSNLKHSNFSNRLQKTNIQKAYHSNMFLDSPKFNEKSQPFLNYYGHNKGGSDDETSQNYMLPMKKQNIKSAKRQSSNNVILKRVAKTDGHVKMTQQNILDWNQIQTQMVNSSKQHRNKKPKQSNQSSASTTPINNNTKVIRNFQALHSNTQITQQMNQQQGYQQVINTALAKQQRNRYIEYEKRQKQRKLKERKQWQQELRKQSLFHVNSNDNSLSKKI